MNELIICLFFHMQITLYSNNSIMAMFLCDLHNDVFLNRPMKNDLYYDTFLNITMTNDFYKTPFLNKSTRKDLLNASFLNKLMR